ncbi:relaxase/mobilization nuclease domain-containing protein [Fusibacter paucivorans]|uniref:Relaxase/mobilization nuclease domain-containing protein n=1 Tax=Fusibacter paucivorans TaxID=76009 RepID=A0ABS5PUA9_9FIRM|nr:relaxase/mobilization nuclease domain-containing protein [Fusibacter paucivorans]MBS7528745.1 relaxase/mobilization nuclease domain-containing protein [Fusibacter paucivorans]
MAITKIMNIGAGKKGKITNHLKHALDYIMNESKTESGVLVGGWNCVPKFAFEQMVGTKELYGKMGGRQGYHFVISCPPGEGTPEQLLELMREFAQEFLGEDYEAVYSVHADKEHCHGHLVFNSVNMNTGKKYEYKKGDWKHQIQPITNRLCEKYGLSIMPAEYSKDPVNMNRKQWEKEQSWSGFIEADVKYCRGVADDYAHFIYLLEELGYVLKQGAHLAVKANKMKRFRRLDTISEEFSKENLQEFFDKGRYQYESPRILTPDVRYLPKPKNSYQQKFYGKIYRMRVVEKCRFQYKSACFKEDLERMHMLQEEYLFLCRKDVKSVTDIAGIIGLAKYDLERLTEKQKSLYLERAEIKRKSTNNHDWDSIISTEPEYRKKLDDIKLEKKRLKKEIKIGDRCLKEILYVDLFVPEGVEIGNVYDVKVPKKPWYLKKEEKKVLNETVDGKDNVAESKDFSDCGNWSSNDCYELITDNKEQTFKAGSGAKVAVTEEADPVSEYSNKEVDFTSEIVEKAEETEEQEQVVTKEIYEVMTDKEKAEWIGIDSNDMLVSIKQFHEKLKSIGITYQYISDETEEYCRLEEAIKKNSEPSWYYRNQDKRR